MLWFKGRKNQDSSSFTKFSIMDFYPSFSKDLLAKAINFTCTIVAIEKQVIYTTMYSIYFFCLIIMKSASNRIIQILTLQ